MGENACEAAALVALISSDRLPTRLVPLLRMDFVSPIHKQREVAGVAGADRLRSAELQSVISFLQFSMSNWREPILALLGKVKRRSPLSKIGGLQQQRTATTSLRSTQRL